MPIDLDRDEVDIESKEDYFKGLQVISKNSGVVFEGEKERTFLRLIREVNMYATQNFKDLNKVF